MIEHPNIFENIWNSLQYFRKTLKRWLNNAYKPTPISRIGSQSYWFCGSTFSVLDSSAEKVKRSLLDRIRPASIVQNILSRIYYLRFPVVIVIMRIIFIWLCALHQDKRTIAGLDRCIAYDRWTCGNQLRRGRIHSLTTNKTALSRSFVIITATGPPFKSYFHSSNKHSK